MAGIAQWGVRAMDKITVPMGLNGCLKYSSVLCAAAVLHCFVTFFRLCWWLLPNGSDCESFAKSEAGSRALIKLNCSAAVRRNPVAKGKGRITASPLVGAFSCAIPSVLLMPAAGYCTPSANAGLAGISRRCVWGGVRRGLASAQGRGKGGRS